MAHVYKMDAAPTGPVYAYATLAALRQAADGGDASAAILLAEMSETEQRLARSLVETFAGKSESKPKRARPPKPPKPPKASMRALWEADRLSPDPVRRLIAAKALAEMAK